MSKNQLLAVLPEMAIFVKVVETGSFSGAARQLGFTPSVVSRSVARLERELKTQVLLRTTRKLRLSDSGVEVYKHCCQMLESAYAAMEVSGTFSAEPAGKLRLCAPRALGRFLIHPHIPAFLARYPQVDVVFRMEDHAPDLMAEQIDLAFCITDEPPPGLMGRRLMRIEHIVCATPAYLARHGTPLHPHELKQHSCIALSEDVVDSRWKFSKEGKTATVDVEGRYTANHTGVRLDAVLQHLGIGGLPYFTARQALEEGLVCQVLPDWTFRTNYYGDAWVLYAPTRHVPPNVRVFIDHIAGQLAR